MDVLDRENIDDKMNEGIWHLGKCWSAFMKDISFSCEKEMRLMVELPDSYFCENDLNDSCSSDVIGRKLEFRNKGCGVLAPFIKLKFDDAFSQVFKGVIIPYGRGSLAKSGFNRLFSAQGYGDVFVRESGVGVRL